MKLKLLLTLTVLLALADVARAQGTAFTYQGRLDSGGTAASGHFEMSFTLHDAVTNGNSVGPLVTVASLAVSNGFFTAILDFGAGVFTGMPRWLEIAVRTNGAGAFATLNPRQPITAAPYAVTAGSLSGVLPGGSLSGYYGNAMSFYNPANWFQGSFNGSYQGDGAGLANLGVGSLRLGGALEIGVARFERSRVPAGVSSYGTPQRLTAVGDFNLDGWPDVAICDIRSFPQVSLTIYTNTTQGSFSFMWQTTTNLSVVPYAFAAGDLNGDGRPDLVMANSGFWEPVGSSVSVYLSTPNSWGYAGDLATGQMPNGLLIEDLNGDGRPDLAVVNGRSGTLQVFVNTGVGLPSLAGTYPAASGPISIGSGVSAQVACGDINGDGRRDLVVGIAGGWLSLMTNVSGATFAMAAHFVPEDLGQQAMSFYSLYCADLDGDSVPEIVFDSNNESGVAAKILKRDAGSFNWRTWKTPAGNASRNLIVADINLDGRPDLIVGNQVMVNGGDGNFGVDAQFEGFAWWGDGNAPTLAADFDRDGRMDLFEPGWLFRNTCGVTTRGDFEVKDSAGIPRFTVNHEGLRFAATNGAVFSVSSSNGVMTGNGSGLTQLDASQVTAGTLPDARLSANVAQRPGGNAFTGIQTITAGAFGVGTLSPQAHIHAYSAGPVAILRLQSGAQPGAGRVEFLSDPQGSASEWRPGYIQSSDNGGFSGGLAFVVNGMGYDNRFGEVETMRIVNGRVGIGTATPSSALQVVGTVTATAFNPTSDRNAKENFAPVSPREVLDKVTALPISRWNFKGDVATDHVGPMAQDFHAAFGVGTDERHIATVDADGVALAAIQGLNQKLTEELKQKGTEITELKARLDKLEALILERTAGTK